MALIEVHGVHKAFAKTEILHGVDLCIEGGQIVGLLGPSGCGKTTLVDIMVGNAVAEQGSVLLGGETAPYRKIRLQLGYMPQETALYEDITAWDNLRFFGTLYGLWGRALRERAQAALKLAWLEDQGKKVVRNFSGGMKRRLSLAVALLSAPTILILDEPTVGLDPVHRNHLWQSFRAMAAEGAAILITTHVMDEALQCDKVAMMREGSIIACNSPRALIADTGCSTLEDAFIALAQDEGEEAPDA